MSRIVFTMLLLFPIACRDGGQTHRETPGDTEPVVTVASTTQIGRINDGLPDGLSIDRAYAVRSISHTWAHYVAARARSGFGADTVGVWFFYDGMDIPGEGYAVNAYARAVSAFDPFPEFHAENIDDHPEVAALVKLTASKP